MSRTPGFVTGPGLAPLGRIGQWTDRRPWLSDGTRTAFYKQSLKISVNGLVGLLAASGEWLSYRLSRLSKDDGLERVVDALWYATVHGKAMIKHPERAAIDGSGTEYMKPAELYVKQPYDANDTDPVRAPKREFIKLAIGALGTALDPAGFDFSFAFEIESAVRLVEHTVGDALFKKWQRAIMPRLATLTKKNASEAVYRKGGPKRTKTFAFWGPPLPREAFDPKHKGELPAPENYPKTLDRTTNDCLPPVGR
jgi:hypothetical protein